MRRVNAIAAPQMVSPMFSTASSAIGLMRPKAAQLTSKITSQIQNQLPNSPLLRNVTQIVHNSTVGAVKSHHAEMLKAIDSMGMQKAVCDVAKTLVKDYSASFIKDAAKVGASGFGIGIVDSVLSECNVDKTILKQCFNKLDIDLENEAVISESKKDVKEKFSPSKEKEDKSISDKELVEMNKIEAGISKMLAENLGMDMQDLVSKASKALEHGQSAIEGGIKKKVLGSTIDNALSSFDKISLASDAHKTIFVAGITAGHLAVSSGKCIVPEIIDNAKSAASMMRKSFENMNPSTQMDSSRVVASPNISGVASKGNNVGR